MVIFSVSHALAVAVFLVCLVFFYSISLCPDSTVVTAQSNSLAFFAFASIRIMSAATSTLRITGNLRVFEQELHGLCQLSLHLKVHGISLPLDTMHLVMESLAWRVGSMEEEEAAAEAEAEAWNLLCMEQEEEALYE